jgi:hypothetical protein
MKITNAVLAELTGWRARLWDFSPSHDRLVLQLRLEGAEKFVVFVGCESICLPVSWVVGRPELRSAGPDYFEFADGQVRILHQESSVWNDYRRSA